MVRLSYWVAPILGGLVWLAMLLALLLYWIVADDRAHYPSMAPGQTIAYISDVGAADLKPLFIAGCSATTVLLDASFAADRWLRHRGRLAPNLTLREKVLSGLTIAFAVVGTAGLILLSVFDTARHPRLHNVFLLFFIAGYVFSAIFICWEYHVLGKHHRDQRILRVSFWIKVVFVLVEVVLAVAFAACTFTDRKNEGAVLEWVIAAIFSAYVFSFFVDLYPAAKTKEQLQLSGDGRGGLSMKLTRGRDLNSEHRAGRGGGGGGAFIDAAAEMEEGSSDATWSVSNRGAGSFDAARAARGRRSGSRSRAMASNF